MADRPCAPDGNHIARSYARPILDIDLGQVAGAAKNQILLVGGDNTAGITFALHHFTGSKAHNIVLRGMAIPKGSTNVNSAKLMLDYILSHDGQVGFGKGGTLHLNGAKVTMVHAVHSASIDFTGKGLLPAGDAAIIQVIPTSSPQSERTNALVDRLRDEVENRA